jgi:hypothetical protein
MSGLLHFTIARGVLSLRDCCMRYFLHGALAEIITIITTIIKSLDEKKKLQF